MSKKYTNDVFDIRIWIDHSGQGHKWQLIDKSEMPLDILNEIEAEIIDGGIEECKSYFASNGCRYRWKR